MNFGIGDGLVCKDTMMIKNSFRIDTPTDADVPTLVSWGRSAPELWASDDDGWHSEKSLREWIRKVRDDVLLVARIDGKLGGMCFVHHMGDWAYCTTLFVDEQYRTIGIGSKLLDEAHKRMKAEGINYFALLVKENNTLAQEFYKKRNFQQGFRFVWMYKKRR